MQRTVRQALCRTRCPDGEMRMRHKLVRWKLTGLKGTTAWRCILYLDRLRSKIPPRVSAAWLRTLWNGWTTARRFQQGSSACLLGCGSRISNEDSIEHYADCRVFRRVAHTFLRLPAPACGHALGDFVTLGLHRAVDSDDILARRALLTCVRSLPGCQHNSPPTQACG